MESKYAVLVWSRNESSREMELIPDIDQRAGTQGTMRSGGYPWQTGVCDLTS